MSKQYRKYKDWHKDIDGILHKRCIDCLEWKPANLENFGSNIGEKSGLNNRCRICATINNHKYYTENIDHIKKQSLEWQLSHPEQWHKKCNDAYAQNKWGVKDIVRQNSATRRENGKHNDWLYNTEAGQESMRVSKEKRKKKEHKVSDKEWIACKNYFKDEDGDWACCYCGLKAKNHYNKYAGKIILQELHKEHVDDDGSIFLNNCASSCHTCNSEKHDKELDDWYNESNPKYTKERYDKIIKWTTEDYKLYITPKHLKQLEDTY